MTQELREKVALMISSSIMAGETSQQAADAAIAIIRAEVLEEAARVCDEHAARYEKDIEKSDDDGTLQSVAAALRGRSAAIRALKD